MKILHRVSLYLYARIEKKGKHIRHQVISDLEHLNPGGDRQKLCREYYVKKIEKTILLCVIGSVLAFSLLLKSLVNRDAEFEKFLTRGSFFENSKMISLEAEYEGKKDIFQVEVKAKQMSEEEINECYESFCQQLPSLILGKNTSLDRVEEDLLLLDCYEGYPFEVTWRSYNPDAISSSGIICSQNESQNVQLKAQICLEDYEWEENFNCTIIAKELAGDEKVKKEISDLLMQAESETRKQQQIVLPEQLNGKQIKWKLPLNLNGLYLWIGVLGISTLIYFMEDKDLHDRLGQKKQIMKREYADIVYKLALYLGAGMTLRGAFQKLSSGYEQIQYTCRELSLGVTEAMAYENMGKRIGLQEYVKLSTLMSQNLKRGSTSLLERLYEEADKALTEKIRMGRKLGEEAATKLLLPMVMMLAVVMVMVMLPAFSSMGM